MSAPISPVCGLAYTMLSILIARTGPSLRTGSPVNGDRSRVGVGEGVGVGVGDGVPRGLATGVLAPVITAAPTPMPAAATTADAATMILVLMCHMTACRPLVCRWYPGRRYRTK